MSDSITGFRQAMSAAGLVFDGPILPDGKLHRIDCAGEKGAASWFVCHQVGTFLAGAFGCWRRGIKETWNSGNGDMSPEERRAINLKIAESQKAQKTEEERLRSEAKIRAQQILSAATTPTAHAYLTRKQVGVHGELRLNKDDSLVLPLRDHQGVLQSLQFIAPDKRFHENRDKAFLLNGQTKGCFYAIDDRESGPLVICEGYATGATIHEATGWATVCAMFASNLKPVAESFRKKFPDRSLIIAADNDRFTKGNPGLTTAQEVATTVKAIVAYPEFADESTEGTDFNDLALVSGLNAVALTFQKNRPMSFMSPSQIMSLTTTSSNLLGDRVLCRGSLAAFIAAGGTGKSTLILQLAAACVARHEKYLIWDIHPEMYDLKWMIIQAENSTERMQKDIASVKAWIGPEAHADFDKQVVILAQETEADCFLELDNPDVQSKLLSEIDFHQPDVVVFDALYNFTLRELSKGAEMLASVSNCTRLAKRGNPRRLPIILHHALPGSSGSVRATGFDRANFGRDSKVLHQLCRSVVNISQASEDDTDLLLISCGKCSDAREFLPFVIRRNPETLILELDSESNVVEIINNLKNAGKSSTSPSITSDRVRELTSVAGSLKSDLAKRIVADCGCTPRTAYRHIKTALFKKVIRESNDLETIFRN